MDKFVSTRINGYIATVTIDRPPVNAMTRDTYREVRDAFRALNEQSHIRVAILTGAGPMFSAGVDMKVEFLGRNPDKLVAVLQMIEAAADAIQRCRIPVIGAINGPAFAGGFVLASACDILFASDEAQFGLPEVSVGIVGGSERLRRLVPESKARLLALTGESISGAELFRLGSVEKVVPSERLLHEAETFAHIIASRSPLAIQGAKKSQNYLEQNPATGDAARYHAAMSRELFVTKDAAEAVDAFFARRAPIFEGC